MQINLSDAVGFIVVIGAEPSIHDVLPHVVRRQANEIGQFFNADELMFLFAELVFDALNYLSAVALTAPGDALYILGVDTNSL